MCFSDIRILSYLLNPTKNNVSRQDAKKQIGVSGA